MIQFKRKIECALALVLSLVILLSVIPVSWVSSEEYTSSVLTTNIGDSTLAVNQVSEFTVTTEANDDVNKMVVGTIKFSDPEAVESLEYHAEDGENGWVAITEGFKAEEGFALADETIEFRVVINKTGNFTVEVTINDFNDGSEVSKVSAEFVVDQAEITDVTVEPVSVPYDGSELLLANIQGIKEGDVVTCKINDEIVDSIEDLKGVSVGNYEITVTVDRGPDYKLFEKTVISSIVLGNLELGDIRIKGIEEVYTGDAYEAVIVTRPENSDYTLEYSLDGGEWSDIIPTVIDAGSYTVKVKATKVNYNDKEVDVEKAESAEYPFNVYIAKAEQTNFRFNYPSPDSLPYNAEFENKARGGQSGGEITYEVISGAEYVSVDQEGKVIAVKAGGSATIKATRAGNKNYKDVEATYSIYTIKAEQEGFTFEEEEYSVWYGTREFNIVAKGGQSNGNINYEIISGSDIGSVSVKDNVCTIKLNSGKIGEMTVRAILNGGENYKDAYVETNIKILTKKFDDKYVVEACPETGWYTEGVDITAEDGYMISRSNQFDSEWGEKVSIEVENLTSDVVVFLKEINTGYISDITLVGDIRIDKTIPTKLEITYSPSVIDVLLEGLTFGFYNSEMTVSVAATDLISKINRFVYQIGDGEEVTISKEDIIFSGDNGETATASFTIPANLSRSQIKLTAYDNAGLSQTIIDDKHLVVDDIAPEISVSYDNNEAQNGSYFQGKRTATISIKEENFFENYLYEKMPGTEESYLTITVGKRGDNESDYTYSYLQPEFKYDEDHKLYYTTVEFIDDADYTFEIEFYDYSSNKATVDYGTSIAPKAFTIDNTAPEVSISYNDENAKKSEDNEGYFAGNRNIIITIKEHNFNASDIDFTNTNAKNILGDDIAKEELENISKYFKDSTEWSKEGNTYTASYTVKADANYNIDLNYTDLAGNKSKEAKDNFHLDNVAPYDLKISYSESIIDVILNGISFGFYNAKRKMEVTITASDDVAGVDYFTYSYVVDCGDDKDGHKNDVSASDVVVDKDDVIRYEDEEQVINGKLEVVKNGNKASAKFNIPAQFRGYISFTATDKSGNESELFKDDKRIVVDESAPVVKVTFDNNEAFKLHEDDEKRYFEGTRTATISIKEENFFENYLYEKMPGTEKSYLTITVGKCGDNESNYNYSYPQPEFAKIGDSYVATVEFKDDADYTFDVEFYDYSLNKATVVYDDKSVAPTDFTIDNIKPEVSVDLSYIGEKTDNIVNGCLYLTNDDAVEITVTVTEHNFNAKNLDFSKLSIKDSAGNDVENDDINELKEDIEKYFKETEWENENNTHIATYKINVPDDKDIDAIYKFVVACTDLAGNSGKNDSVKEFAIDTKNPVDLSVAYKDYAPKDNVGYYGQQVEVTISAVDATSYIKQFNYSYKVPEGVSSVNSGMNNIIINEENISHNGNVSYATFFIPKEALNANNQFNGTVTFTATDMVGQNTEFIDAKNIVVDNIAPKATVTFNEPIVKANDISYYTTNINAKIVINEANFFSGDVDVKVNGNKVNVVWSDRDSNDISTGTFSISGDGDYKVTVEYTDRSGNKMTTYTSNRLTIDTKAPVVSVSNIKNNSANADEKYGFTITAKDLNLNSTTFKPSLTAVVLNEDGTFSTKNISLGNVTTVKNGEEYSYTVNNLVDDAIYSLVCTVEDMAKNKYEKVVLSDGKEYNKVSFSINRKGSTFGVETSTAALVEKHYIQNVNDNVVVIETNTDELTEYKVTLNGKELTKDTDYTVTQEGGNGSWMKYNYNINKSLFANEGEYKVVISSKDKVNNDAFSDVKGAVVDFVVDRTAPIVTVSGLADNGRYQTNEQKVTIIPTDDGGALKSLIVRTVDENGAQLSEILSLSGEELEAALEQDSGKINFMVKKGLYQNIQIICSDYAVNENGETNVYDKIIKNVSVDSNVFIVKFWANKTLRWGSIAGVILLAAAITLFVVYKKKKTR